MSELSIQQVQLSPYDDLQQIDDLQQSNQYQFKVTPDEQQNQINKKRLYIDIRQQLRNQLSHQADINYANQFCKPFFQKTNNKILERKNKIIQQFETIKLQNTYRKQSQQSECQSLSQRLQQKFDYLVTQNIIQLSSQLRQFLPTKEMSLMHKFIAQLSQGNDFKSAIQVLSPRLQQIVKLVILPNSTNKILTPEMKQQIAELLNIKKQQLHSLRKVIKSQIRPQTELQRLVESIQSTGEIPDNYYDFIASYNQCTEFFKSIQNQDYFKFKTLLKQNRLLVQDVNDQFETGLHIALRVQNYKMCEKLIRYGSKLDTKDLNGISCLDLIEQQNLQMLLVKV